MHVSGDPLLRVQVVAEIGNPVQLLQRAGLYADMWQRQVQDYGSLDNDLDNR